MKYFLLFSFLCVTIFTSCEADKRDELDKEVMVVHDEAMAKLGQIKSAKKKLRTFLAQDSLIQDSMKNVVLNHVQALQEADNAMMDWMANYRKPAEEVSATEAAKYLRAEKEKISEVRELMFNSLKEGEQLLRDITQD